MNEKKLTWHKVAEAEHLGEDRVASVTCENRTFCLSHFEGKWAAFDNKCPHQGGPLGEGAIEDGWLRCPWHGWDFHPLTGASPGGFEDTLEKFPVEVREDGIYLGVPAEPDHERTVADVMIETMVNWGVKHVWGMVGHSNLGVADAMRRQAIEGNLSYYGIRHEGAAAFAASAYGKLTGRPAACFAIAGPGATNMLTGLWDAHVDRSPTLALTGQVSSQVIGTGNFQEVDLTKAYGGVALFGHDVLPNSDHAELMTRACKTAILEQGVSHLVFPDEVQIEKAPDVKAGGPEGRITPRNISPPPEELERAVDILSEVKRPVIIVGHGARFHMEGIIALAEEIGAPVITTFKGKGLISDHHPLGCGVLGRSGTPIASWFMNESDALLVFGASFSKHTGIEPKKPIIQVDYDPMVLGKHHKITVPLWGEVGTTAKLLLQRLTDNNVCKDHRDEVAQRWQIWRDEKAKRRLETNGEGVHSAVIFDAMTRLVPENAIISLDVGNNTYSFGRYFESTSQAVLMSGYLGSIGFSFPGAMGAWAATREEGTPWHGRPVVSVSGDGGFGQYLAEFMTARLYDMNITHVLLNNSELGKISKEQRAANHDVWQTRLHNLNFAEYANSCGGLGIRVETDEELDAALEQALAYDGPALVEVMADVSLI